MRLAEVASVIRNGKIKQKDLIIAFLVFTIAALLFFGWHFFFTRENPLSTGVGSGGDEYRYLFSIYNKEQMSRPMGVAVSDRGEVVVADSANHRIAVFGKDGSFQKALGGAGNGPGQFNYPTGVAVSGRKIYVADFYNQRVQVIDFDGKQLSVLPAARDRQKTGPVVMPVTVAADSRGNVYVSDVGRQRVIVFDDSGNFVRSFGSGGSGSGELSYVNGIAVDYEGSGHIYVSNSNNGRVDIFSLEGKFIKTALGSNRLTNPRGIAFDSESGMVYVVDTFAHQVLELDKNGSVTEVIGKRGIDGGSFNFPSSVIVDGNGRLYVADRENSRVEVYTR